VGVWMAIAAIGALAIVLRLIGVAGAIWRERARVLSHCTRMETAATSGTMFCERLSDGTTLLIVPTPSPDQPSTAEARPPQLHQKASL
jgi:hypothetical protein